MEICLVAAASENNALGYQGNLLWHLPNDLKFFKNTTWGTAVAMGRKTYDSINRIPLKGRYNIIITRQDVLEAPGCTVVSNLKDAIYDASNHGYAQIMVVGGGEIYAAALPMATTIYLTRVHAVFTPADAFFPEINLEEWTLTNEQVFEMDDKHAYSYTIQQWNRK